MSTCTYYLGSTTDRLVSGEATASARYSRESVSVGHCVATRHVRFFLPGCVSCACSLCLGSECPHRPCVRLQYPSTDNTLESWTGIFVLYHEYIFDLGGNEMQTGLSVRSTIDRRATRGYAQWVTAFGTWAMLFSVRPPLLHMLSLLPGFGVSPNGRASDSVVYIHIQWRAGNILYCIFKIFQFEAATKYEWIHWYEARSIMMSCWAELS